MPFVGSSFFHPSFVWLPVKLVRDEGTKWVGKTPEGAEVTVDPKKTMHAHESAFKVRLHSRRETLPFAICDFSSFVSVGNFGA